jgi:hypothetical protein
VLCGLLLLLMLQFLLLGVSVEGWLSGKREHLLAATLGSVACFVASTAMLRLLFPDVARGLRGEPRPSAPPVRKLRAGEEAPSGPTGRWEGAAARGQD